MLIFERESSRLPYPVLQFGCLKWLKLFERVHFFILWGKKCWVIITHNSQNKYLCISRMLLWKFYNASKDTYVICRVYWLRSKECACNEGDSGSVSGSGRSPGGGHGNPLQYSCLGNPMDRGAWWAAVCSVAQSRTWLRWLRGSRAE